MVSFSPTSNTELNDLRKIIGLRKSEVSVERISACNIIEKMTEHGQQLAYTVCQAPISMTSLIGYHNNCDIILMSR